MCAFDKLPSVVNEMGVKKNHNRNGRERKKKKRGKVVVAHTFLLLLPLTRLAEDMGATFSAASRIESDDDGPAMNLRLWKLAEPIWLVNKITRPLPEKKRFHA